MVLIPIALGTQDRRPHNPHPGVKRGPPEEHLPLAQTETAGPLSTEWGARIGVGTWSLGIWLTNLRLTKAAFSLCFWPVSTFPSTKSSGWGFQRRFMPLTAFGHLPFGLQTYLLKVLGQINRARG